MKQYNKTDPQWFGHLKYSDLGYKKRKRFYIQEGLTEIRQYMQLPKLRVQTKNNNKNASSYTKRSITA